MNIPNQEKGIKILLIDDDEDDFILTRDTLRELNHILYHLDWEMSYTDARRRIMEQKHDVYLVDYRLGELDGLNLIAEAVKEGVSAPMILLTGRGDKKIDLRAMEEGASDYLIKSEITPDLLERTIRYSLNHSQALRQVTEKERKYRQLFERSIDAIYISDLDFVLEDVNPSFCKLIGQSVDQICGKRINTLFHDRESFGKLKEKLAEGDGQVKDYEIQLTGSKGDVLICQITMVERQDHNGVKVGYHGIIHDVTLKKRAEEELLLAERLSMTGKLARSIAHEIRNPLTNLGLAMDQLEDELREDSENGKIYNDIIRRNVKRIEQLISELLNSSKHKELDKVPYQVDVLVEESLAFVKDRLTLKGMKLDRAYERSGTVFEVDPEKMRVALTNILVNSVEAMEENKGKLLISTKEVDEAVYIRITDNGKGINEEDQHLLFDPFYTKKKGGMGLGLTTTQSIIHSHHGQIRVKSEPGEGTSFTICIPKNFQK